jgi:hypothetical protein
LHFYDRPLFLNVLADSAVITATRGQVFFTRVLYLHQPFFAIPAMRDFAEKQSEEPVRGSAGIFQAT